MSSLYKVNEIIYDVMFAIIEDYYNSIIRLSEQCKHQSV